jgi:hypothetical protein
MSEAVELVCCACGMLTWLPGMEQYVGPSEDGKIAGFHAEAGCGPELLHEGKTCRGASGTWEWECFVCDLWKPTWVCLPQHGPFEFVFYEKKP